MKQLFEVNLTVHVGKKAPVTVEDRFNIIAECAEDAICGARVAADTRFAPKTVTSTRLLSVHPIADVDLVY